MMLEVVAWPTIPWKSFLIRFCIYKELIHLTISTLLIIFLQLSNGRRRFQCGEHKIRNINFLGTFGKIILNQIQIIKTGDCP